MDENENYCVKDINLANQGQMNIEYAEKQMKALLKIKQRFEKEKPLKGTAVLVKTLKTGGADVAICSCNPLSTQDDVAASLAKQGFRVYGYKGETTEDYYKFLNKVIEFKPNITIDDGCDLVSEIHKNHKELIKDIIGGCEETTTGVIRLSIQ